MPVPLRGALAAAALAALFVLGCGGREEPAVAVSGKLLENGEPIKPLEKMPPGDKGWRMSFVPEGGDKSGGTQFAQISDDGSFRVEGPKGKGIAPGKYRISVQKGAMGTPQTKTIDVPAVEIPNAKSVTVEVDAGKKTAKVVP